MDLPEPDAMKENKEIEKTDVDQVLQVVEVKDAELIIKHINDCLLPKLAMNYDESETHAEFDTRNQNLDGKIKTLTEDLENYDFKSSLDTETTESDLSNAMGIVSSLLILYKELLCNCSWNSDNSKEYAKKLNDCFYVKCNIKLEDVLKKNEICDCQKLYDKTLDALCKKLSSNDFKKYPGLIEVYSDLVQNIKEFDVTVNSIKILPIALILMDDHIESNKIKGLLCCHVLLKQLTDKDFEDDNYYDVVYLSVKRALNNRDRKITELSQDCALELCRIFPTDIKDEKLDEMYVVALEKLATESNLYTKASLLKYVKNIIQMLEIKCVMHSFFKLIISDTIESCLIDSVAEILLMPALEVKFRRPRHVLYDPDDNITAVIHRSRIPSWKITQTLFTHSSVAGGDECLEEWIKYCWPVWKLSEDYNVLCALLKYYSKCNTGEGGLLTQKLIATLVSLCTSEEQKQFSGYLEGLDDEEEEEKEKEEQKEEEKNEEKKEEKNEEKKDEKKEEPKEEEKNAEKKEEKNEEKNDESPKTDDKKEDVVVNTNSE